MSEAQPGFDPTAVIESDPALDALTAATQEQQTEQEIETRSQLKDHFASQVISDLSFITQQTIPAFSESLTIFIDPKHLKEAASATKNTIQKITPPPCKVSIWLGVIKLSTFNNVAFSEWLIPTQQPTQGVQQDKPQHISIDHNILSRLSDKLTEPIEATIIPAKQMIRIQSGRSSLEIPLLPPQELVNYSKKIESSGDPVKIDVSALKSATEYISLVSKKEESQQAFSVVETRGDSIVGGTSSVFGILKHPSLASIKLGLKNENLPILDKALSFLHNVNSYLIDTPAYLILRDENFYLGIEKTTLSFPNIAPVLAQKAMPDSISIPREDLKNSLLKLAIVSQNRDQPVSFTINGLGTEAVLTCLTQDQSGKTSSDALKIFRSNPSNQDTPITLKTLSAPMLKILNYIDSTNVSMSIIPEKLIIIKHENQNLKTETIITILK